MKRKTYLGPLLRLMASVVAIACVSGCDQKPTAAVPSQLAAKMGGEEVTLHEVDRIAEQEQVPTGTDSKVTRKRIVDALIDQHLMAAEAIKLKLDHSPDVVSDQESCRLSTLQHAYVTSIIGAQADAADWNKDAAQSYYDAHPDLFAQRKLFLVRELVFPKTDAISLSSIEALPETDALALLEQQHIKYRLTYGPVTADALPQEVLGAVVALDNGHTKALQVAGEVVVLTRISASAAPVDFATAEPGIANLLKTKVLSQRIQDQVAMLRNQASVQYLNEFAPEPVASNVGSALVER